MEERGATLLALLDLEDGGITRRWTMSQVSDLDQEGPTLNLELLPPPKAPRRLSLLGGLGFFCGYPQLPPFMTRWFPDRRGLAGDDGGPRGRRLDFVVQGPQHLQQARSVLGRFAPHAL